MTSPTPTPAHQAFREKRARAYHRENGQGYSAFLSGMAIEFQVAQMMGFKWGVHNASLCKTPEEMNKLFDEAEAQLAALLEGK